MMSATTTVVVIETHVSSSKWSKRGVNWLRISQHMDYRHTRKIRATLQRIMKLHQGQKYEDFYLVPSSLMEKMMGGRQKIIVPKSLRQQILKKFHDVPFTLAMWACARLWN